MEETVIKSAAEKYYDRLRQIIWFYKCNSGAGLET